MAEIEQLKKDKERLDWLERFLQLGGSSVFTSPACHAHQERPDDTEETTWNHPFAIGYQVEAEHRGCYRWEELANGAKGIRPAIDAARAKHATNQDPSPALGVARVQPKRCATTICHHCKKQIRVRPERGDWLNAIEMVKHGECKGGYSEVKTENIIWPNHQSDPRRE